MKTGFTAQGKAGLEKHKRNPNAPTRRSLKRRTFRILPATYETLKSDAARMNCSLDALADIRLSDGAVGLPAVYSQIAEALAPLAAISARAVRALDLLITDLRREGVDTRALSRDMRQLAGDCRVVYTSVLASVRKEIKEQGAPDYTARGVEH